MRMPGMDGLTLLGRVRALQPHALRIILSGQMTPASDTALDVAHHLLNKPYNFEEILALIAHRREGATRLEAS
jgi:DNA-binding NtrC family response regulator